MKNGEITIKEARKFADMTEQEACKAMGVTLARLRAWESGKTMPSVQNAILIGQTYKLPLDVISFNKKVNQGEPKAAQQLTVDNITAMPERSWFWYAFNDIDEEGICWHCIVPMMIKRAGFGGSLIGFTEGGEIGFDINNGLTEIMDCSFWNTLPDHSMLLGISEREYNKITIGKRIMFTSLATAITSRGLSFDKLCEMTGISLKRLYRILTDENQIVQHEMVAIRSVLGLTDDETRKTFFPEFAENKYDSYGNLIKPVALAQI